MAAELTPEQIAELVKLVIWAAQKHGSISDTTAERLTAALEQQASALQRLQEEHATLKAERDRHDCERWRSEGIGCAECNPIALEISQSCSEHPLVQNRIALEVRIAALTEEVEHWKGPHVELIRPYFEEAEAAKTEVRALREAQQQADAALARANDVLNRLSARLVKHRLFRPDDRLTDAQRAVNDAIDILAEALPLASSTPERSATE